MSTTPAQLPDPLLVQVARLYFDERLTRVDIGDRLSISRFKVARLLDEAIASGVVRIELDSAASIDLNRSSELERRFRLKLALVADGPDGGTDVGRRFLAVMAGRLAVNLLRPDDIVGISWGRMMAAIAESLPVRQAGGVRVVEVAGGSPMFGAEENPHDVSRLFARRLGAEHHPLFAPALVESASMRDALLAEPALASTVGLWDRVSLALVGVGSLMPVDAAARSSVAAAWASDGDLDPPVGETMLHAFRADGSWVPPVGYPIALSLDQLRAVERVIVVAGGVAKADAIRAVLNGEVADILVTDVAAARALTDDTTRRRSRRPGRSVGRTP